MHHVGVPECVGCLIKNWTRTIIQIPGLYKDPVHSTNMLPHRFVFWIRETTVDRGWTSSYASIYVRWDIKTYIAYLICHSNKK